MGEHKSAKTLEIVQFLKEIGECLNYVVKIEDKMFPGKRTSPILDLTWRRYENQRSPIFIFEIDSTPEKSASDNALKIFSKPTEQFQKPLFFFHVFVKQKNQTDRIDSLKSEYNKSNYDVYLLSIHGSSSKLLYDILEQHFKIDKFVDLQNLLILLEERNPLNVKTEVILEKLIQLDFDKIPGTGFLSTLESFLIHKEYKFIKPFYCNYLKRYLEFDQSIEQNYPPYYTIRYS
ncbi:MAG TPA: hypothetical protein PJ988_11665, partial [Anaerolinea sp.]|nr:hypothetical protein [Anaerolinea sp.]